MSLYLYFAKLQPTLNTDTPDATILMQHHGNELTEDLPRKWSDYSARYRDSVYDASSIAGTGYLPDFVRADIEINQLQATQMIRLLNKLFSWQFYQLNEPYAGWLSNKEVVELYSYLSNHKQTLNSKYLHLLMDILALALNEHTGIITYML